MTKSPNLEKIVKASQWLIIVAFITLIWLPALDFCFHLDKTPAPNEKRPLVAFPNLKPGLEGVREFITGLEAYYNDHFGFRKRLIRWERRWKQSWFRESSMIDVISGRNGWLYLARDKMIENSSGMTRFTPKELEDWRALLESRRDWLAKKGISYVFVIPPNKESIYPEYLPDWLKKMNPVTKLDQFLAYMKTNSTVEVVDLRPCLLETKKEQQVYLVYDTHWNIYGAFVAHKVLVQTLSRQMPGLEPLSLDHFEIQATNEPAGDLATLLGQESFLMEKDNPILLPRPELAPLTVNIEPNLIPGTKWPVRNQPKVTLNPKATGSAIVFRDSFATKWIPFLGYYFNKVTYLWKYNWEPAFIEEQKPDVVIDEMLERLFYNEDPAKLKALDALN